MKKAIVTFLCLLFISPVFGQDDCKKQILLINARDSYEPYKNALVELLTEELRIVNCKPEFIYEDLDTPHIFSQSQFEKKRKDFLKRSQNIKPDLVIFLYNSSFQLLQQDVYDKWGDIPTILYAERQTIGADNQALFEKTFSDNDSIRYLSEFNERRNFTIIYNKVHIYETISMMKQMIPKLEEIGFIYDNKWSGIQNAKLFVRYMKQYFPDIRMRLLSNKKMNTTQLLDTINLMPPNTALIYSSWVRVKRDQLSAHYDARIHTIVSGLSKYPIFTLYDYGVKEGVFAGGFFPFTKTILSTITESAVEKLFPPPYSHIDQSIHVIAYPVLNYRYISARKLPINGLLADSFFYDRPENFLKEHETAIILGGFTVSLIFVVGLLFIFYLRKSRIAKQRELERTKKMMQQLVEAKEKAEESERMKSAFLANISHEIRTPLNSIIGFSDIIANGDLDPQEKKEFINTIHFNNDLLLRLIDDLLILSRLEHDKEEFVFEPFELYPAMEMIKEEYRLRLKKDQMLVFDHHSPKCKILSDKNRLTQVIINLVSNAIKFTPQGTIQYGYELMDKNETVRFYVKDTGKGIPSDKLEKVFERFYKVNSFTQGTGLGLPICQSLVHKLGGCIEVQSEEGVGTTFWVYLPVGM